MISNLKIGTRLSLGFGLVLALLVVSVWVALDRMNLMASNLKRIVKVYHLELHHANEMEKSTHLVQRYIRTMLISDDAKELEENRQKIAEARKAYDEASDALAKLLVTDEAKAKFTAITQDRDIARGLNSEVMQLIQAGKKKEASAHLLGSARTSTAAWVKALDDLDQFLNKQMAQKYEEAETAYRDARNLLLVFAAVALVVGIVASLTLTRSVVRPVQTFVGLLGSAAEGDLRVEAEVGSKDEIGELGASLNRMLTRMREGMLQVQEAAQAIAQASGEIASGNADLSSRTEEQAANLEETASTVEEFSSTIQQTSENAHQAFLASQRTQGVAESGGASVRRLVVSMEEINVASAKIAEIIGVVDEIAFQTNLLALNAAVEAARAGEQGRGFAVVASEVRNLAKRSAEAAKEVKDLIRDSVGKAQEGKKAADQTGADMQAVLEQIAKTSGYIGDIARASKEENQSAGEISKAILQLDQVTQQNAALVEEAAAAADSLDQQAQALNEVVGRFRTGSEARAAAPRQAGRTQVSAGRPTRPAAENLGRGRAPRTLSASNSPAPSRPTDEDGSWGSF